MVSGTTWPGGDPFLQRQNEPSIAVSTRNPLHLLAGANDYRTVDLSVLTDRVIGDAWLGVFKSLNGGQTWRSTVLPGCSLSIPECATTPANIMGFQAGSDPTVRAGTNGMFYYSGIAFNRGENQPGAVFVARLIDDNNLERPVDDPIRYISTAVVDTGNSGQFLDKPWLAVDIPRAGAGMCTIPGVAGTSSGPGVPVQTFPAGNVYLAYSIFVGNDNNIRTKIMFARSTDCGATWSHSLKLSEGYPINQGVAVAVAPDGTIYVAWRQFQVLSGSGAVLNPDAILIAKSTDGGQTFTKAMLVTELTPFEQGSSGFSIRTNAFPTMAIAPEPLSHRVYIAFAARVGPEGDGRIVLTSSTDGMSWTAPTAINDPPPSVEYNPFARGHDMMPALSFAGGKLTLVYYDMREDHTVGELQCLSPPCTSTSQLTEARQPAGELLPPPQLAQVFNTFLADAQPPGFTTPLLKRRHTLDVRVAQANPGPSPAFVSTRVSQYPFGKPSNSPITKPIEQLRFNPPNLPMFAQGTVPFFGDYIDIAAQQFFPVANPGWAYNTAPSNSTVFHAVWTDNRDVRPPANNDWTKYTPVIAPPVGPAGPGCNAGFTGTRNQNIYTSRISQGLIAGVLQNFKQLGTIPNTTTLLQRAFIVFVQNTTNQARTFRLTIANQPLGSQASFLQFPLSPFPFPLTNLDVSVARRSTVSRPVFVTSTDPDASVTVNIVEFSAPGGSPVPGGLQSAVVLNPDISNPDISNPDISNPDISNAEVYNPDISNPDISNPDISNPDISNPDISNPDISNPDISNPDITNPDISNPDISNPDISNPDISNPDISNPDISNGALTDGIWKVRNKGNTSASYNIKLLATGGVPAGFELQLILYKVYRTLAAQGCTLQQVPHNILLSNIINPTVFTDPSTIGTPDISNPALTNATLALAPGEEARIALRVNGPTKAAVVSFLQNNVQPVAVSQAANTGTMTPPFALPSPASGLTITTLLLADAVIGTPYSQTLSATGGSGVQTWSLAPASPPLPPGLALSSAGVISGTPTANSIYNFIVRVVDSSSPQQSDVQSLQIRVVPASSSVALSTSAGLAVFGAGLTLTANVSPAPPLSESPMVEFFDGVTSLGTAPVGAGGVANLNLGGLSLQSHSLTAKFLGTPSVPMSTSAAVTQHVIRFFFNDLAGFTSALGGATVATQDFSSFSSGTPISTIITGVLDVSSPFANLEVFSGGVLFGFDSTTRLAGNGRYQLSFVASRNALGFDIGAQDPNTSPARVEVQTSAGNVTYPVNNPSGVETTPTFFGMIASLPINNVIVHEGFEVPSSPGVNEEIVLDNFRVAQVTVLPPSLAGSTGPLTFNGAGNLVGRWTQNVSQLFELTVDLGAKTTSLSVDGLPIAAAQNIPFFQPTAADLKRVSVELGTTGTQILAWDDVQVSNPSETTRILRADFNADTVGSPPSTTASPGPGTLSFTPANGQIIVRATSGNLLNQPVEVEQFGGVNSVNLAGIVSGTPPTTGIWKIRWRSLMKQPGTMFPFIFVPVVVRDSGSLILGGPEYR